MNLRITHLILVTAAIAFSALLVGCGRSKKAQPELVEKVREIIARILKREVSQIDFRKPLGLQGANELDIVEIVMEVEDTFKIEIPDKYVEEKPVEVAKTMTVQKLADIVAEQIDRQKR